MVWGRLYQPRTDPRTRRHRFRDHAELHISFYIPAALDLDTNCHTQAIGILSTLKGTVDKYHLHR